MRRRKTYNTASFENENGFTRKMIVFVLGLVFIFVVVQFIKLATVGRLGSEISKVKVKQDKIILQNELIRSAISKLRTSQNIQSGLQESGMYVQKEVNIIEYTDFEEDAFVAQE